MNLSDFQKIVLMNTLSGVGMGLVGIFIPIYLLQLHFLLAAVISWLLVLHLSILIGAFVVVFISNGIGLVRCWYIRVVFTAALFSGLLLLPTHSILFYILAIIAGLEAAFFWIPYNIFMVRKTDYATMGSSLAFISNISTAVGIVIPGCAALLIVFVGYPALFAIAFVFILLSLVPVLSLRHEKTDFRFSWPDIRRIISTNRQLIIPEIIDNFGEDAQVVWSIFVFVAGLTVLDIGALGIIASLVGIAVTYVTGSLIDHWDKKKVIRFGAVLTTFMWVASYLVATFSPTPLLLYSVTAVRALALGIFVSAYSTIVFNRARTDDAQFLVLREIPTILGRTLLFVLALFLVSIRQFESTFLIVAVVSLYFWFNNLDALLKAPSSKI